MASKIYDEYIANDPRKVGVNGLRGIRVNEDRAKFLESLTPEDMKGLKMEDTTPEERVFLNPKVDELLNLEYLSRQPHTAAERELQHRAIMQGEPAEKNIGAWTSENIPDFGKSKYDLNANDISDLLDLEDLRARNQSTFLRWSNGILKGVGLAATTFLSGNPISMGGGAIDAIAEGDASKMFNNEWQNALHSVNQWLEEALPNYRTKAEREDPWYQHIWSANFWADSFIKNLGFTVGALYSGGMWAKPLQLLANGTKWGAMGAKAVGSVAQAAAEGVIEANNQFHDSLNLSKMQIDDAYKNARIALDNNRGLYTDEQYIQELTNLANKRETLMQEAEDRASKAGVTTMLGNIALLTLNNYDMFGKFYARGFREGIGKAVLKETKDGVRYAFNKTTMPYAIGAGLRHAALEGNEEMAQQLIASASDAYYMTDTPDTYYQALTDPNYQRKANDFMGAFTEGLAKSYGDGSQWEQFAVGALTGIMGVPTFGRVSNSASDVWAGKGSPIGMTGGMFGEIASALRENAEGEKAVAYMNQFRDKVLAQKTYFAQNNFFNDAMDGFSEAGDKFEFVNAKDNALANAYVRFSNMGRLGDLKEMVNKMDEDLTDEDLESIATFNPPSTTGQKNWVNADGTFMSSTEDGRKKMREIISQRKNEMLKQLDDFEESVNLAQAIGNNALTQDQVAELAWLHWKQKRFKDRFDEISKDSNFNKFVNDINNTLTGFENGRGRGSIDETTEEGKNIIRGLKATHQLFEAIGSMQNPLAMASLLENNPDIVKFFSSGFISSYLEDLADIDTDTFNKNLTAMQDLIKMGKAAKAFNERFKEFQQDPIKLIKNREKIDAKTEKTKNAINKTQVKDNVDNTEVSDLVKQSEDGVIDLGNLEKMFSEEEGKSTKDKVTEAKNVISTTNSLEKIIDADEESSPQAKADAKKLLQKSKGKANSVAELTNLEGETFLDTANLTDENLSDAERQLNEEELSERQGEALTLLNKALRKLEEDDSALDDLPDGDMPTNIEDEIETTGYDESPSVEAVNSEKEQRKKEKAKREKEKSEKQSSTETEIDADEILVGIREVLPPTILSQFNTLTQNLIDGMKMLIKGDTSIPQIRKTLKESTTYDNITKLLGAIDNNLVDAFNIYLDAKIADEIIKANGVKSEESTDETETQTVEDDVDIPTPTVNEDDIKAQEGETFTRERSDETDAPDVYNYWKPATTEYGIHNPITNLDIPFYEVAKIFLKQRNGEKLDSTEEKIYRAYYPYLSKSASTYTEEKVKRFEEVYKYLRDKGAFTTVNLGYLKEGDEIRFTTDKELNEKVGETIILMIDSQGRVIGDVMPKSDSAAGRQTGLLAFIDRFENEYQKKGEPDNFVFSETTQVDRMKIGKVPFRGNGNRDNLNHIYDSKDFKLGVSMSSGSNSDIKMTGSSKKEGLNKEERSILKPLQATAGQPYLLMETNTGRLKYVTVPFIMKPYSKETENTKLGTAIENVLKGFATANKSNLMSVKNALTELLSFKRISINYIGDSGNTLVITYETSDGKKGNVSINKNSPNLVDVIASNFKETGVPFQVSRKYINSSYNGELYNRMIGEIAEINLIGTHTVNNWFTIKPLDETGKMTKAEKTKTTGFNPNAKAKTTVVNWKGVDYTINTGDSTNDWKVKDNSGKEYQGERTDIVKAIAFRKVHNLSTSSPYTTPWGIFDPNKNVFITEEEAKQQREKKVEVVKAFDLSEIEDKQPVESQSETTTPETINVEDLEKLAKDKGLLATEKKRNIWNALTNEQKQILASKEGPKAQQWIRKLEQNFNNATKKFKDGFSVDKLFDGTAKYRQQESETYQPWDSKKETAWLEKALPQFSTGERLKLVKGLIKIAGSDDYAYGMFQRGIITLSDVAARGTLYHEAFHAVLNTLLSPSEVESAFEEARKQWGDVGSLVLEENMAEDFRRYIQLEETPVLGNLIKIYRYLKHVIQTLIGNETYLNSLYYNISRNKLAQREIQQNNIDEVRYDVGMRAIEQEMQDIKAKALKDGTFMKAPNGNPTNLNERQWLQVRTKAFKEWFGDWMKGLSIEQDKSSYYRGQYDEPIIDNNGNLILHGRKDSLYERAGYKIDKGVSATRDMQSAVEYGDGQLETRYNLAEASLDESERESILDNGYYLIQFKDDVSNETIKESGEVKLVGDVILPKGSYIIEHYVGGELVETIGNIDNDASKVVDENGEPLVVYHGTSRILNNNSFKSEFIFTSDNDIIGAGYGFQIKGFSIGIDYALSSFTGKDINLFKEHIENLIKELENEIELGEDIPFYQEGDLDARKNLLKELKNAKQEINSRDIFKELEFNVFNLFQNVKNPLMIDAKEKYWHSIEFEGTIKSTDELAKIAKDRGYDGLIIKNVIDKGAEVSKNGEYAEVANDYVAFNPNQIKSATDNIGTFSRTNDDIRYKMADNLTVADFQRITNSRVNNSYLWHTKVQMNKAWGELVDYWEENGYIVKGYYDRKNKQWTVTSAVRSENYDNSKAYYRKVKQYHNDKLMYGNLSKENRDYLELRGISIQEYNQMSPIEKEVLFKCK